MQLKKVCRETVYLQDTQSEQHEIPVQVSVCGKKLTNIDQINYSTQSLKESILALSTQGYNQYSLR